MSLAAGPLAPAWIVFPMALAAMVVVAGHLSALARADMPASRRRIRRANGWLMMFLVVGMACAAGLATTQRVFVMLWMFVAGLTGLVLILAWLDAVNSLRIHRRDRLQLQQHARQLVAARLRTSSAAPEPSHDEPPRA